MLRSHPPWSLDGLPTWRTGAQTVTLVPGRSWTFGNALDSFRFWIDAAGDVASVDDAVAAVPAGHTLALQTAPLDVVAGEVTARWHTFPTLPFNQTRTGDATVTLVKGLKATVGVGQTKPFVVLLDETGAAAVLNGDPRQVSTSGNDLVFQGVQVTLDPGAYIGKYVPLADNLTHSGVVSYGEIAGGRNRVKIAGVEGDYDVPLSCLDAPTVTSATIGPATFTVSCEAFVYDQDEDTVPDDVDNCPTVWNREQEVCDADPYGNACDDDDDDDVAADLFDNCPCEANPDQADLDGDGFGDPCDEDRDGDGVADEDDNCPDHANAQQNNSDFDALGDACDPDDDEDGVADEIDVCPKLWDDQADYDGDGEGDACDQDRDADLVGNDADECDDTPLDALVDAGGCSGEQRTGLVCLTPADHANHGRYVSCVATTANRLRDQGLLTQDERNRVVGAASKAR